jgi:two-component system OmpR family sensor kinase
MLPTLALAGLAAVLLVAFTHRRARAQLMRTLQNSLATKTEEVASVLAAGPDALDLASFLELETAYSASPYEYYFELADEDGRVLLGSTNLGQAALGTAGEEGQVLAVHPHPLRPGEEVLLRSERLEPAARFAGVPAPRVRVAVCLAPAERVLRAELGQAALEATGALAGLAAALWLVVARSLRSVSAITRRAAQIRATNLRARLPLNGSGDELDTLSRVLNELFSGVERSLQQMDAFTSDAAHQLRTPLTRIRAELDLLLAGEGLDPGTRERLGEVREELERLAGTCARLLLLARLDRGALESELRAQVVDLADLAEGMVEAVAPLAAEKSVRVRRSGLGRLQVTGCRELLSEALFNLLENAIRFTPPGGRVDLRVARRGSWLLVLVRDTGPGVERGEQELVFQRFFRGRNGRAHGGTGLGLAIVRGIARAHGGEAGLRSVLGRGARVYLRLPA